jgi:hypothetical protein
LESSVTKSIVSVSRRDNNEEKVPEGLAPRYYTLRIERKRWYACWEAMEDHENAVYGRF